MLIGYDSFGLLYTGTVSDKRVVQAGYNEMEFSAGTLDELFVDENPSVYETPKELAKPDGWHFRTVVWSTFQGNLEGGTIYAGGYPIDYILYQKRPKGTLKWLDIASHEYDSTQTVYTALDRYIRNGYTYEYSFVPYANGLQGDRVTGADVEVAFEGSFISDSANTFRLIYDLQHGQVMHNRASAVLNPLNSKYPIVTYGSLDYRTGTISATFISADTALYNTGEVQLRSEQEARKQLLDFLKDQKPKVLRGENGEFMLVTITGNPTESPYNNIKGLATLNVEFAEVGDVEDNLTMRALGMIEGLEEI
jgi:hypothetical protein